MKIEVWSDFVCPFCYIGKHRLENALAQFPHKDQTNIEWRSFELDPNAPVYSGLRIEDILAKKYGISIEQAKQANQGVAAQAAELGLLFDFEKMKPTNSFDAHRLAKYAKTQNRDAVLSEKLFKAHFTEGRDIGDRKTLSALAESAGLDRTEAEKVLQDQKAFADDVRKDEALARQYGITGVPFFLFNSKYAVSGAQPPETFRSALETAWQEEAASPAFQDLSTEKDVTCADGSCVIPEK
ncbi:MULTISPECIES: DsbA family oxidoreductase [unclassified Sporolactobacillus]|uniref:DsbA family oxidoreductase n=1 Tax=unclassified Sporolactobacillus TaxID=2628533 RepID=UPI002367FD26|nr:DsbA family oxidoreductase [Sporolactobacillus sp. CQH2019]MDD9150121.1 DsbA family oxidoreductase [Sporolactobacillus sp. CQH2019]